MTNGHRDPQPLVEAQKSAVDEAVLRETHIAPRTQEEGMFAPATGTDLLFFMASAADQFAEWGRNPKLRDRQLREFWPTEGIFASAVASMAMRNAGFSWDIEGPPRTAARVHDMLLNANLGKGWLDFMVKLSLDLYTQDNGAFIEIVRAGTTEDSPVIGLNHLDSWRCWHTGVPEAPVVYQDRRGKNHWLRSWEVATLSEVPTPIETLYGLQYCVLTRVLRRCQIMRNIAIYDDEKSGGRHTRGLHLVRGLSTTQINQALRQGQTMDDLAGRLRYSAPPVLGTVDPAVELQHILIDFVALPENYKEEDALKWYLVQLAIGFGVDYQDLAPLPGGNLGTSAQSEILHLKSRGKGPAMFMKLIAQTFNQGILPSNTEFLWKEQDEEAEKTTAEIRQLRAETRKSRIESGEISPEVARQIAHDDGDLEEEYLVALGTSDQTTDVTLEDDRQTEPQIAADARRGPAVPGNSQPGDNQDAKSTPPPRQPGGPPLQFSARERALVDELTSFVTAPLVGREKSTVAEFLQTRIHKAFTMAADDLAALGYMDTEGRIELSSIIGDALRGFALDIEDRAAAVAFALLDEHDARQLIEQLKEAAAERAIEQVTPERLALDEEMAARLAPIFLAMKAEATKKLRALA